jgi:hypothetical protein
MRLIVRRFFGDAWRVAIANTNKGGALSKKFNALTVETPDSKTS